RTEVRHQILYDRADIAFRAGNVPQATALLDQLLKKDLDAAAAAKAWFLKGDLDSEGGNYAAAVKSYAACLKNHPGSEMETAACGRLGDCYYSLYTRDKNDAALGQAIEYYHRLVNRKELNEVIRQQTLFKLGQCFEQKKDDGKALEYYKELLFNQKIAVASGRCTRPIWTVKAAYAAIDIYLDRDTPEAAAEAIRIYRILQGLDLNIGEDYLKIMTRIKQKFKL
ncbi:MAG: tetratricopeptide repeat protein, partial [Victivallales bacterium]|nr:tetratricopeptide repeat protein [Victivallales bacterium]